MKTLILMALLFAACTKETNSTSNIETPTTQTIAPDQTDQSDINEFSQLQMEGFYRSVKGTYISHKSPTYKEIGSTFDEYTISNDGSFKLKRSYVWNSSLSTPFYFEKSGKFVTHGGDTTIAFNNDGCAINYQDYILRTRKLNSTSVVEIKFDSESNYKPFLSNKFDAGFDNTGATQDTNCSQYESLLIAEKDQNSNRLPASIKKK